MHVSQRTHHKSTREGESMKRGLGEGKAHREGNTPRLQLLRSPRASPVGVQTQVCQSTTLIMRFDEGYTLDAETISGSVDEALRTMCAMLLYRVSARDVT